MKGDRGENRPNLITDVVEGFKEVEADDHAAGPCVRKYFAGFDAQVIRFENQQLA